MEVNPRVTGIEKDNLPLEELKKCKTCTGDGCENLGCILHQKWLSARN